MNRRPLQFVITWIGLSMAAWAFAMPVDTSFSYQGQLQDSAAPAVGLYEFEFELFDAESSGFSLAQTIAQTLELDDGIFSTRLDFGDAPFAGEAVWMEVRVRAAGATGFTTLVPRQAIVNAPYAVHAQFTGPDSVTGFSVVNESLNGADLAPGAVGAVAVNSDEVQLRLSAACPDGQAVQDINANGAPVCAALGDDDWFSSAGANTTDKRVAVGSFGFTGARLYVVHDSSIFQPQIELRERGQDYSRLTFLTTGVEPNTHANFWSIAAQTYPDVSNGPDADRINFYNSRSGDQMVLLGNGNLGLGVFTPDERLDVNGTILIRALTSASAPPVRTVRVDPTGRLLTDDATARPVTVSRAAFRPSSSTSGYSTFAGVIRINSGQTGTLSADVQIPDGARIGLITAYLYDNSAVRNLEVSLVQPNPATNTSAVRARFESSGTGTGLQYRPFTDNWTAGRWNSSSPLLISVRAIDANTNANANWDSSLGISAVTIEVFEP
ncbi:MAG: hypothetical protein AAGH65_03005 [Pseudomonadota bacterium]